METLMPTGALVHRCKADHQSFMLVLLIDIGVLQMLQSNLGSQGPLA